MTPRITHFGNVHNNKFCEQKQTVHFELCFSTIPAEEETAVFIRSSKLEGQGLRVFSNWYSGQFKSSKQLHIFEMWGMLRNVDNDK
jgi:hypothetical protein